MKRGISQRARTDLRVETHQGALSSRYRGIEISPTGILIDRGRRIAARDLPLYVRLSIRLPESLFTLRALARPVWSFGTQQAFKFVEMSDVDRLNLAEHVDLMHRRAHTYPAC